MTESMAERLKIASQGQGLPLVFIHGWGLNSAVWQPCLAQLQVDFEVITIDLPGFATNSGFQVAEYSLVNLAKKVQQAVAKPAVYIGWSLGGLVASQITINYPEQVLGLITVASSPQFVEEDNWPGIKKAVLAMFHQQLAQDTTKTISNFLKIQAMGSPNVRQDIKKIRDLVMQHEQPSQQILDDSLALLTSSNLSNALSDIHQPFLRLYGKLDGLVPKQVIPLIDDLVPNSDCHIFAQASHAPFISHQEEFLLIVKSWLLRHFNKD
ncbi:pimeloyl-ACP methyl ester esterase BioH [Colwellia sp. M166]|uniref:pimeloyl-ACP methyl ester esterase BioH n=1 Tax=Colwellia sp. M166 TaxID=2583805 RepID=UPI00211E0749|nr:pimeloyl-ACP methyl ester esterase BioH [Colwellia sp. M166]UUO23916.1 pimeloyl-ACP methyl ester esterase BioH [Colwellia sp. M166]|tara:strand:- start:6873 stop:7673 length:801 start_codon:yes stop_codon:yes gene_type:complete